MDSKVDQVVVKARVKKVALFGFYSLTLENINVESGGDINIKEPRLFIYCTLLLFSIQSLHS